MTTFFTADLHIGHENIIKYCQRPFTDADEMDAELVKRWNERVSRNDDVYYLGDFALRCSAQHARDVAVSLNGHIYFVRGNHDSLAEQMKSRWEWMRDYAEITVPDAEAQNGSQRLVLMHYPLLTWRGSGHGAWMLHGHCHGTIHPERTFIEGVEDDTHPVVRGRMRQLVSGACVLDVGTDVWGFAPISYEEIKAFLAQRIAQRNAGDEAVCVGA